MVATRPVRPLRPRGPYTQWLWPPAPTGDDGRRGYRDLVHELTPESDPGPGSCYFWAHQFRTAGGEGGYLGLQTWGNRADGTLGKMAIFSFWEALEADGPGTVRFSGEGVGWSCRIPLRWEAGRSYRLEVALVAAEPDGDWWAASVGGEEFGRIRVPGGWGGMGEWSVMWTEYYGPPLGACADLAYARARFGEPRAQGGAVRPLRSQSHVGEGDCHTTRITEVAGGVRQEMGVPHGGE